MRDTAGDPVPTPLAERRAFRLAEAIVAAVHPITIPLLARGLTGPFGRRLLLLEFRGRRTGLTFRTPVGYARDGDTLIAVTGRAYRWWRNVDAGAAVRVRLPDGWHEAWAEPIVPLDPRFATLVHAYVGIRGAALLRSFGLAVDDHGRLHRDPDETRALLVLFTLEDAARGS